MKKFINTILCIAFAVAAFSMFMQIFEGNGRLWHWVMCILFACSSVAFSGKLTKDDRYRRIS